MREYDQPTLQRVQQLELMILKDFMDLCDRHGLTYFGLAGTGIGAVRHQGFIPWDDDIDVGLPRADYEQFVRYAQEELSDKYILLNARIDPNFPLMTTHLILKGTKFRMESFKDVPCPFGIFLDIFPFDQVSDDERAFRAQGEKAWFYNKLMILRALPFPMLPVQGWKAKVIYAATGLIHAVLAVLHISKPWLAQKCLDACTQYNGDPPTARLNFICDTTTDMNLWDREALFPLVKLPFEGMLLPFGNDLHSSLTRMYGDYMQLPPVEKRKNHFPYELDFGPYADIPLEELRTYHETVTQ